MPGEPDYHRMVSDYITKLEQEKKITDAHPVTTRGWHGFHGRMKEDVTSRFGRHLPAIGCLVEIVLLWPDQRDSACEEDVLASIDAVTDDREGCRRWRAFGLDLRVPASAAFEGCTVLPARAEFAFTEPRSGNRWEFARLGMVHGWFNGNLDQWLLSALGKSVRDPRITRRDHHGVDLHLAEGAFKPQTIHLRHGQFQAAAWLDRTDGRIYCVKKFIRKEAPGTEIPAEQLLRSTG